MVLMRYLGNKEAIVSEIVEVIENNNLLKKELVFFDAFSGTGTVANMLKQKFKLVINDNLYFATTFSRGRILKGHCKFEKLGFDPIEYFNSNEKTYPGFFTNNYSPAISGRMYFSDFNAGRIDYFRDQIKQWFQDGLIDDDEKAYLIASLLESVSKVANVAGVYGAFLKTWDPRAVKKINFIEVEGPISDKRPHIVKTYNNNLSEIIEEVEADILYLDPPYTKNKYSVQYHVLETLARNDNPTIKGITGARDNSKISDDWSKKHVVEREFEVTIAKTKARHIIVSYSSDGIMSVDYIANVLKRHGDSNSYQLKKVPYKKYRNSRTKSKNKEHYEYIFYIEKKNKQEVIYYCPLNYMGGKTAVVPTLKKYLTGKSKFVDLMAGGFNVGINVNGFERVIYNDINFIVKDLIMMFKRLDSSVILNKIEKIIKKYNLEKNEKNAYIKFREDYNNILRNQVDQALYLYTLILYGFQQQIRFNSSLEFNNPVGESGFNESVKEKIVSFSRIIKEKDVDFYSKDYEDLINKIDKDTLIYIDPPYLITLGSYNDGKRGFVGWNEEEEERLLDFIDTIKERGCKIVISNILNYRGKQNSVLKKWINDNEAETVSITTRGRQEVIVIYEAQV